CAAEIQQQGQTAGREQLSTKVGAVDLPWGAGRASHIDALKLLQAVQRADDIAFPLVLSRTDGLTQSAACGLAAQTCHLAQIVGGDRCYGVAASALCCDVAFGA